MSPKQTILLTLIILVAIAAWYGFSQYNRKNKDLAFTRPDIAITSAELVGAFATSERLANEKFLDKIIAVTGKVKELTKDDSGYYTIVLGEEDLGSSVRCSMDTTHTENIASVKQGQQVTIRGACTGYNADELLGSDVILNRAVVADKN